MSNEVDNLKSQLTALARSYQSKSNADRRVYSITYRVLQWGTPILSSVLATLAASDKAGGMGLPTPAAWMVPTLGLVVTVLAVISSSLRPKEQCILNALWVNWFRSYLLNLDGELAQVAAKPAPDNDALKFILAKQHELSRNIEAYHRGAEPPADKLVTG